LKPFFSAFWDKRNLGKVKVKINQKFQKYSNVLNESREDILPTSLVSDEEEERSVHTHDYRFDRDSFSNDVDTCRCGCFGTFFVDRQKRFVDGFGDEKFFFFFQKLAQFCFALKSFLDSQSLQKIIQTRFIFESEFGKRQLDGGFRETFGAQKSRSFFDCSQHFVVIFFLFFSGKNNHCFEAITVFFQQGLKGFVFAFEIRKSGGLMHHIDLFFLFGESGESTWFSVFCFERSCPFSFEIETIRQHQKIFFLHFFEEFFDKTIRCLRDPIVDFFSTFQGVYFRIEKFLHFFSKTGRNFQVFV